MTIDALSAADWTTIPARETSDPDCLCPSPRVSVLVLAYNHGPYIKQALAGILAQDGGVPIELLIGEDRSTDDTASICREWQTRHPEVIRLITAPVNVGMHMNLLRLLARARAPYVALCEGDDYWTEPSKLTRQLEYMENRPSFALCGARTLNMQRRPWPVSGVYGALDVLRCYPFHTSTVLFRRHCLQAFPRAFLGIKALDAALFALLAEKGPCGLLDTCVSYYRRHEGGVWSGMSLAGRHAEICRFTDVLSAHFAKGARPALLAREFALSREVAASALSLSDGVAWRDVRGIARKGWRRLRTAFPLRVTGWFALVHAYPLIAVYRRMRRRLAMGRRLRLAAARWNGTCSGSTL